MTAAARPHPARVAATAAVLAAGFVAHALVQAWPPGVNEPQYVAKARHWWDREFCPGDFFLDSSDPHAVFDTLVGPLTLTGNFFAAAVVARVAGLSLLAAGFAALASRLSPRPFAPVWAAAAFLVLHAVGNLSGEWVVGGAEGKVFAYGLLLLAAASWADGTPRRRLAAAALAGGAVSFHPVVGGWGVLCAAGAAAWNFPRPPLSRRRQAAGRLSRERTRDARRPSATAKRGTGFGNAAAQAMLFLACAAPGLIPALATLGGSGGASATVTQVYGRLAHHLDPLRFPPIGWVAYAHLLVGWWLVRRRAFGPGRLSAEAWWSRTVVAAVLLADVGLLVGLRTVPPEVSPFTPLRAAVLKFYPFRLADVLVPLAACLAFGAGIERVLARVPPAAAWAARAGIPGLFAASLLVPHYDRVPQGPASRDRAAFASASRWCDAHLPADALVLTPTSSVGFLWWGRRAQYVTRKNCPQDAAGIREWDRRLALLNRWAVLAAGDGTVDPADLRTLAAATGVTHVLAGPRLPVVGVEPVFANGWYRVFDVRPPPPERRG